jgi:hypothetical protein
VTFLHPHLAEDVRRALLAWRHVRHADGQTLAAGYDHLLGLVTAAATRQPDTPPWLTLDQAARRANVSTRTLRRWRAEGLPTVRRAGRLTIDTDDLDRWTGSGQLPANSGHRAA